MRCRSCGWFPSHISIFGEILCARCHRWASDFLLTPQVRFIWLYH